MRWSNKGKLTILGVLLIVLYMIANRAIYYPEKYPLGDWEQQSVFHAEDVWLRARDGVKIHGWMVKRPEAKLVTLFLHGNAGNITHRWRHLREIETSLLLIDYRGYGKSEGRPTEKGLYADADAAYEYLIAQGFAPNRIVLHGESLGTGVAVDLAARRPCAGVILEAPYTSIGAVAGTIVPVLGRCSFAGTIPSQRSPGCMRRC
jgi:fermentation-respiration switch protein FrsA (DUF1100 family)